jgi:hypothetical protein
MGLLAALAACGGGSPGPDAGAPDANVPVVLGVDPVSITAGSADTSVVVQGERFTRTSVVRWNHDPLTTFYVSELQLGALVPASKLVAATRAFVDVATPGSAASNAVAVNVFVQHAVPTLDSLSPNSAVTTDAPVVVRLNGTGFIPESKVIIDGTQHASEFASSTQLRVELDSNDLRSGGTFFVSVSNPGPGGGLSANVPFTVLNPVPAITAIDPSTALVNTSTGLNLTGTGFAPASTVTWNGLPLTAFYDSPTKLEVTPPALTSPGTFTLIVSNPPPGGGTSAPFHFTVDGGHPVLEVPRAADDVVWDGTRGVLYASIYSAAPFGNSIQVIDPDGGSVVGARDAGIGPSKLALSDDRQFLYVGLRGEKAVQRFTLPSLTPSLQYPIGDDPSFGPYAPGDIQVAPGKPHTVAVTRTWGGSPDTIGGVVVFDDATPRPVAAPSFGGTGYIYSSLQWNADGTHLYANNGESTGFEFIAMTVTADGLRIERVTPDAFPGFSRSVHFVSTTGLLYGDDGIVLDPMTGAQIGSFPVAEDALMVPDPSLNRAFFLVRASPGQPGYVVQKYDLTQRTLLGSIDLPALEGTPRRFIRWGSRGLAIVTSTFNPDGHLYLVSGGFVDG